MQKSIGALFVLALATVASAGITNADFAGSGNIAVLAGDDWREASPTKDKVGCLNSHGKLIKDDGKEACGVFTRLNTYPYTLSTKEGNCTFVDQSQEKNTDSYYGANDHAFNCNPTYESVIYDQLYTIDGFPHVFLCFGDVACFYDSKKAPESKEKLPLWQYRWGSQQMGITPGHVQMLLMWEGIDKPKNKDTKATPQSRVKLTDDFQIPLRGMQARV